MSDPMVVADCEECGAGVDLVALELMCCPACGSDQIRSAPFDPGERDLGPLPGEAPLKIVGPDDFLWCECENGYICPGHRHDYPADWPPPRRR